MVSGFVRELPFEHGPVTGGIITTCTCESPAGARKSHGIGWIYWCMKCGKPLSFKQMDTLEDIVNKET